jgi:hypothetical protein
MKKAKAKEISVAFAVNIERRIFTIRGQRVMLDADLAELFGVPTRRLNEQIKRNLERFPNDFMFQLAREEKEEVVANCDHLHRLKFSPALPHALTEHGAIMAANVLNSPQAIHASVYIVRAFVRMREVIAEHKEIARMVNEHERRLNDQDEVIISIVDEMRRPQPTLQPAKPKRKIGFRK